MKIHHRTFTQPTLLFCLLAGLLLLASLGGREIWTQEWRWGEIVRLMVQQHAYFKPILAGNLYFDKPLLSYWLMTGITQLTGQLTTWTIRLPSAIAGLISLFSIYQIGKKWQSPSVGWLATLMLATCYYFVFWARTASSDVLNLAGILASVAWYFSRREQPGWVSYSVFFSLLALTSLAKGLVGIVIVLLVIAPDALPHFKQHWRGSLLFALLPALCLYFFPFWLTSVANHTPLSQSGLTEVFRENILRFFEPFDHKDPLYTYFIYLPVYLLPWTFFFFPALFYCCQKPKPATKQLLIANLSIFLFLTFSGSRRSYYILPLIPFSLLLTACWVDTNLRLRKLAQLTALASFLLLVSWFGILQPLYYSDGGLVKFSHKLTNGTEKTRHIAFYQADNRFSFYLPHDHITFVANEEADVNDLLRHYDIVITRPKVLPKIQGLSQYTVCLASPHRGNRWRSVVVDDTPVAVSKNPLYLAY